MYFTFVFLNDIYVSHQPFRYFSVITNRSVYRYIYQFLSYLSNLLVDIISSLKLTHIYTNISKSRYKNCDEFLYLKQKHAHHCNQLRDFDVNNCWFYTEHIPHFYEHYKISRCFRNIKSFRNIAMLKFRL